MKKLIFLLILSFLLLLLLSKLQKKRITLLFLKVQLPCKVLHGLLLQHKKKAGLLLMAIR